MAPPPTSTSRRSLSLLGWLALPLCAGLAFASALDNPFVYDDLDSISQNGLIRQVGLSSAFLQGGLTTTGFAQGQFRPLTLFSFSLNYLMGADHPFGYRLVNLILHLLNGILGALVLRQLLTRVPLRAGRPALADAGATTVALLAAIILIVHPVNSLSILLVWKRATLLVTLFFLLAVLCLMALRRGPSQDRQRALLRGGLVASQVLALASKENAAILPVLLLLVDLWLLADLPRRERWRAVLDVQWPTLLVGIAGVLFLLTREPDRISMGRFVYLATEIKVLWRYLAMAFAPTLLSVVYDVVPARLNDAALWLAFLSIVTVAVAALAMVRRAPLPAFTFFWAALALAPTSSLIPIPLLMDEDRVYLAFLPLWALLGCAGVWLAERRSWMRRPVQVGGVVVLVGLLALTLARGSLWSDPEILWSEANQSHPGSSIAATNYCATLIGQPSKTRQALAVCRSGHERFPEQPLLQVNIARAYVEVGDLAKADELMAGFLAKGQPSAALLTLAGHLAWFRNRPAEAIRHYRRALTMKPLDAEVALYLARSYAELDQLDEARSLAQQLERWVPPNEPTFRLSLAVLHHALGWGERACAEYRQLGSLLDSLPPGNSDRGALDRACGSDGHRAER